MLADLRPVAAELVALSDAHGRVLAEPVRARIANPPRDVSAMDGYALASTGLAAGAVLRVVGEAPAGHPWPGRLGPGEAVRLFTGSVMPDGADSVMLQEDAERHGDSVRLTEAPAAGRHIRRAAQDFARDDVLIEAGRRLHARAIGLAAAGNHPWLRVHRRPRIAVLATGDEVALPGEPIPDGGIVSSNGHALAALARAAGAEPMLLPVAADDRDALIAAAEAARGADLLVTTGGASVGDHDLVRDVLRGHGMTLDFWKVAMRPGKPLLHGHLAGLPVLGLPGNPVSALVTAILFLRPAIDRLAGEADAALPLIDAALAAPLPANDQRADYIRARFAWRDGSWHATPFGRQDSAMLRTLADADGLVLRPPHAPPAAVGTRVSALRFVDLGL